MSAMSIPQLAREMGLSRVTIWNRVKSGQIHATKVGRSYVIPSRTVKRLLQREITPARQQRIDGAVKKVVAEYGELLKWLSRE